MGACVWDVVPVRALCVAVEMFTVTPFVVIVMTPSVVLATFVVPPLVAEVPMLVELIDMLLARVAPPLVLVLPMLVPRSVVRVLGLSVVEVLLLDVDAVVPMLVVMVEVAVDVLVAGRHSRHAVQNHWEHAFCHPP